MVVLCSYDVACCFLSALPLSPRRDVFRFQKKKERRKKDRKKEKRRKKKESCQRVKARTSSPLLAIPRVTSLPAASPGNVSIRKLGRSVYVHVVVAGICTLATVVPASCRDSLRGEGEREREKKRKSRKRANLMTADPPPTFSKRAAPLSP